MKTVTILILIMTAVLLPRTTRATDGGPREKVLATKVAPASQPTSLPVPTTAKDAVRIGSDAIAAARSGNWWLFAALVVSILLFGVKLVGTKLGDWWRKLGRWRYVIPPVLSLAAALLATFQGGVSVDAAVGVFTASWATSSLQELWEHGILGKARKGST
jgi:hypothetical protein